MIIVFKDGDIVEFTNNDPRRLIYCLDKIETVVSYETGEVLYCQREGIWTREFALAISNY